MANFGPVAVLGVGIMAFRRWRRWVPAVVVVFGLAGAGSLIPAHAGVRVTGSQMLPVRQGGCAEQYGWDADSGTHSITVRYAVDCDPAGPFLGRVELDENGTPVARVDTFQGHGWLLAQSNPITHDERSVTYPFAKPGRAYTVKAVFDGGADAVAPPNCETRSSGDLLYEECTYATAVTVPFTQDVVTDAPVAAPWSSTGTADLDGGGTCTVSAGAAVTPDGQLAGQGSTSCGPGTVHLYADRRELVPLAVGSSTSTSGWSTSQAQVPIVIPGQTYTVVYVVDGDTLNTYGSGHYLSAPPGCVINGFQGDSSIHCEIAANVTA